MKRKVSQNKVDLPKLLKAWRERHGYTQKEAYEKLGVARRTYENWEMGRGKISARTPRGLALKALLAALTK